MSTTVKAVTSDELFQEWLNKADMNTLKKYFEKKKIEFKREHVSPVETVRNVSKFLVVYFEKKVPQELLTPAAMRTEQTTVNNLQRIKFYDFHGKKVPLEDWKEKSKEVPIFSTVHSVQCTKCQGTGNIKCEKCEGTGFIKCGRCSGSGKILCKACNGRNNFDMSIDVFDGDNKKTKSTLKIPCPTCSQQGTNVCPDCMGNRSVLCRNCEGGYNKCKECKGFGILYAFNVESVPFVIPSKSAMVFYRKDVEKFIDKREVENMLNSREINGIIITNPDDLNQSRLMPDLNYWTPDADKTCSNAKKAYKDLLKQKQLMPETRIMVFPALQLNCVSVKGKSFQVFGIGTTSSFVVLDNNFK